MCEEEMYVKDSVSERLRPELQTTGISQVVWSFPKEMSDLIL